MEKKTGRGVSAGGGQSSLGYLFGGSEAPKSTNVSAPPADKSAPTSQSPPAVDISKQVPAGIQVQATQTNNYHRADGQNTGNFLTVLELSLFLSFSRRDLLFRNMSVLT
jgi:protein SPIRAL1 and related proteins